MYFYIASDIHGNFADFPPPEQEVDACLLMGDLTNTGYPLNFGQ